MFELGKYRGGEKQVVPVERDFCDWIEDVAFGKIVRALREGRIEEVSKMAGLVRLAGYRVLGEEWRGRCEYGVMVALGEPEKFLGLVEKPAKLSRWVEGRKKVRGFETGELQLRLGLLAEPVAVVGAIGAGVGEGLVDKRMATLVGLAASMQLKGWGVLVDRYCLERLAWACREVADTGLTSEEMQRSILTWARLIERSLKLRDKVEDWGVGGGAESLEGWELLGIGTVR